MLANPNLGRQEISPPTIPHKSFWYHYIALSSPHQNFRYNEITLKILLELQPIKKKKKDSTWTPDSGYKFYPYSSWKSSYGCSPKTESGWRHICLTEIKQTELSYCLESTVVYWCFWRNVQQLYIKGGNGKSDYSFSQKAFSDMLLMISDRQGSNFELSGFKDNLLWDHPIHHKKDIFFGVFYSSRVQQIHASHKPPQFRRKLAVICHTCKFSVHPKTTPNPPTLTTPTTPPPY